MAIMNRQPECPECGSTETEVYMEGYDSFAKCYICGHHWKLDGWE